MLAVTGRNKCWASDVIIFQQNGHHLVSNSAGGKYLSTDTQIRLIGSMEPEICTKMLRNLSEKLAEKLSAKFPSTMPSCKVKIASLKDSFSEMFCGAN